MQTTLTGDSISVMMHDKKRRGEALTAKDLAGAANAIAAELATLATAIRSSPGSLRQIDLDKAMQRLSVLGAAVHRVAVYVTEAQDRTMAGADAPAAAFSADAAGQNEKSELLAMTPTGRAILGNSDEGRKFLRERRYRR